MMSLQLKGPGIEILSILKRHGPLSFRGIKQLIKPGRQERKLHLSLARLCKSNLVVKREERIFRGAGTFYQINQDEKYRDRIGIVLACNSNDLLQPFFRSRELLHSEDCALWTQQLEKCFPNATVLRDHELHGNPFAHEILLTQSNDFSLMPDILVVLSQCDSHAVRVAFEVERSRKSSARLLDKLRKYADETTLDGVIYLCRSSDVSQPVRKIFKTKIADKSLRISQYGDYFFLYSNEIEINETVLPQMFSADVQPVLLDRWLEQLQSLPLTMRRTKKFRVGGSLLPPVSSEEKISPASKMQTFR